LQDVVIGHQQVRQFIKQEQEQEQEPQHNHEG
jgi:hypothetical protein